jgi:hypothetical protein
MGVGVVEAECEGVAAADGELGGEGDAAAEKVGAFGVAVLFGVPDSELSGDKEALPVEVADTVTPEAVAGTVPHAVGVREPRVEAVTDTDAESEPEAGGERVSALTVALG